MNNSFKEMQKTGVIKRADASRIKYEDIHVREGFNLRDTSDPDFEADLDALEAHMDRGGKVPDLEVVPRDEGGVWLVDGHRRHIVYGRLIKKGAPIEWIPVTQFIGNDLAQTARVLTSQEGRKLKPLEIAAGYARLVAFGMKPEDVARWVGKTRQHVDQMLILANAPNAVHQLVKAGDVSASVAVDVTRQHGEKAGDVLSKAKQATGRKVTAASVKPWTPPAKVVAPLVETVSAFAKGISNGTHAQLLELEKRKELETHVTISLPAGVLMTLLDQSAGVEDARKAAAEKQRAKAAEAAQGELAEAVA